MSTPTAVECNRRIILFDGLCNLCSGALWFVYRRDRRSLFKFAWVQSEVGHSLVEWAGLPTEEVETMVFIEDGVPYLKSTAFLRIVRLLRFPWPAVALGLLVPRPLRDLAYDWVASHRYTFFGKKESCLIPKGDLVKRFL